MIGWEEYSQHILKSLERLERKIDGQDELLREHMDQEDTRLDRLASRLTRAERDLRWHSKIAGGIGAFFGVIVTWLMESK